MPPLLFVHGAWHGAWCWEEHFLRYFGDRGWSVKAIDVRGHGSAPGRERLRWTRIAEYVADVAEAAAALPEPHGAAPAWRDREPGIKPSPWSHLSDLLSGRDPHRRDWTEDK